MKSININKLNLKKLQLINFGTDARVYHDKHFAYKVFHMENEDLELKKTKVELLSQINLEGLICPLKKIVDPNFVGYSMKYVDGLNIYELNPNRLELITLFKTISNLLKIYHKNNIILSDINPYNILIKSPEEVFFCDVDSCSIDNLDSEAISSISCDFLEQLGIDSNNIEIDEEFDRLSTYLLFLHIVFDGKRFYELTDYEIEKLLMKKNFFKQKELVKTLKNRLIEVPYIGDIL